MAKNRNKKKKNASNEMAVDVAAAEHTATDEAQAKSKLVLVSETFIISSAMDTSETAASVASVAGALRKTKKGRPMKRSQNARKMKAVARAIAKSEKRVEKNSKSETKTLRTKSAKHLYD
ncbi:ribosomal RNA small subunit methyltransferase H [Striga asiatica]|uniref:Ribosomal RNA small subunit methyltransferase H n=1 Tax=Striga asiatica TaxID=4170 RepID=A0A5A7RBB1_STRAF|nr:ribosomal RNA small subunit methyltransferase H [Striga asiatica]